MAGVSRLRVLRHAAGIACGAAFALAAAAPARADSGAVLGRVLEASSPLAAARVYAYQLAEHTLRKVMTDDTGEFLFRDLPAGVYKIIAHKAGYEPAVQLLERRAADKDQFVEVKLQKVAPDAAAGQDFWSLRGEIPNDVLRDLTVEDPPSTLVLVAPSSRFVASKFLTDVEAVTGVQEFENANVAKFSGGQVGMEGRLGATKVAVEGDYRLLDSGIRSAAASGAFQGEASALRVNVETPDQGKIDVATYSNRIDATPDNTGPTPIDFSRYELRFNRPIGEDAATSFSAQYVSQSGVYSQGWAQPEVMPLASRSVRLEGDYSQTIGDTVHLRTGVSYRERSGDFAATSFAAGTPDQRYFDAFGLGDWQMTPAVALQYGLYASAGEAGAVSFTPRTGVAVGLGADWSADAAVSRRVPGGANDPTTRDFLPSRFDDVLACEASESSCYEASLLHGQDQRAPQFAVGGSSREFDRTVQVFFSENFLDQNESIFFVPGDLLRELHASVRHRFAPHVVTQWKAQVAEGGGGAFRAANRRAYENQVAYVATSIDTQFERSATGVSVDYSRVAQQLDPLASAVNRHLALPQSGLERLELAVSQNLATLFHVSSEWAVRLALELSRGETLLQSDAPPDTVRTRFLTGVAVRF